MTLEPDAYDSEKVRGPRDGSRQHDFNRRRRRLILAKRAIEPENNLDASRCHRTPLEPRREPIAKCLHDEDERLDRGDAPLELDALFRDFQRPPCIEGQLV